MAKIKVSLRQTSQGVDVGVEQTRQSLTANIESAALKAVAHDDTLKGSGTLNNPLGISDEILEEIHNAGKVDDVKVDGVSVVSNKIAEIDLTGKVDKTNQADKVYGTNAQGEQTTYDVDSFGQVDDVKVNGTSVVENKVANVSVPTAVSQLTNDANYQTDAEVESAIQLSILDSVQSTSTTHSLSANMGKELQDEIDNLKARGRFLALWNCATGLAESNPPESPYVYQTGDYFIIGIVDTTDPVVNYRPDGSSYTTGVASAVVETAEVAVDDVYYYDGTNWKLQQNTQKTVTFANIAGDPYDNSNLAAALNVKQDKLSSLNAGANITITPGSDVVIPDLYQTVEYIECNGTQWFDTGFIPEGGMIADVKGRPVGGSFWFGSIMPRPTNPSLSRNLVAYVGGNYLPQKVSVYGNSYQKSANEDVEIHLDTRGTRFYATIDNNTVYDLSNTASLTNQTASVKLCYEEYTETISGGRFYSFKIYDSTNTLAVNLIPCYRKTDNVGGFYDAVSGTFLLNQGTGSVIIGPNAPSASDMIISAVDTTYSAGNGLTLNGTTFSVNTINNTTSTSTTNPLSANMGKTLQDQIDNLKARGRFLALWNCATGLAESNPPESPYTYQTGDYFIVGIVDTTDPIVNYRPNGATYTTGVASSTVETEEVAIDDVYYYDGTNWRLQQNTQKTVAFANIAGDPYDNTNLGAALDNKQSKLTSANAGANIDIVNSGTVPDLPTGYVALYYIQNVDGNQWIDTGIGWTSANTKVDLTWGYFGSSSTGGIKAIIGSSNPNGDSNRWGAYSGNANSYYWSVGAGNAFTSNTFIRGAVQNVVMETKNDNTCTQVIDGGIASSDTWSGSFINQGNIFLFRYSYANILHNTGYTRIYRVKLYQDDVLIRDLTPAKRSSDNEIGMYDLVNDVFYANGGTGSFIAGPELEPGSDLVTISAEDTTYSAGTGLILNNTTFSANLTNNLTSTSTSSALTANMGKYLNDHKQDLVDEYTAQEIDTLWGSI